MLTTLKVLSCKLTGKNNVYVVNRRSLLAMRMIGKGMSLKVFCGLMDLPSPATQSTYDLFNSKLVVVCKKVAQDSMFVAVLQESDATHEEGFTLSGDGTWRTPGFSLLQRASTLIGEKTGKTLNVSIKNSYCKSCELWKNKKDTPEYDDWIESHREKCEINHQGRAGSMKVDGIVEMFINSKSKYDVSYLNYVGDGNSKVFKKLFLKNFKSLVDEC